MPRQRSGARPAARPAPRPAAPQQTRSASTASVPARTAPPPPPAPVGAAAQPPAAQGQSPGLFGQMASTAAGVAVGSTVGHMMGAGISGLFGGGSSTAAEPAAEAAPAAQAQSSAWETPSCDVDAKAFTKCLDDNQGNMQICGWYLEQLKSCQAMAKQY